MAACFTTARPWQRGGVGSKGERHRQEEKGESGTSRGCRGFDLIAPRRQEEKILRGGAWARAHARCSTAGAGEQ